MIQTASGGGRWKREKKAGFTHERVRQSTDRTRGSAVNAAEGTAGRGNGGEPPRTAGDSPQPSLHAAPPEILGPARCAPLIRWHQCLPAGQQEQSPGGDSHVNASRKGVSRQTARIRAATRRAAAVNRSFTRMSIRSNTLHSSDAYLWNFFRGRRASVSAPVHYAVNACLAEEEERRWAALEMHVRGGNWKNRPAAPLARRIHQLWNAKRGHGWQQRF